MSRIPSDWDTIELSDAGTWLSGGTPLTSNPAYWGGEIPWISAASLKQFDIDTSDRRVTPAGAQAGTTRVPRDTVLFVVRGMSLKSEFRVGITQRDVTFGQDCKAILPREGIDVRFLTYSLKASSSAILAMVDEAGHGTGRLPTDQLARLPIWIPARSEQKRIVEILDAADKSIRSTEQLISKLDAIQRATTDRLLRPPLSTEWPKSKLREVTTLITKGTTPTTLGRSYVDRGVNFLRVENIRPDGRIDIANVLHIDPTTDQLLARSRVIEGDVLYSIAGSIGRTAVVPSFLGLANTNQAIAIIRVDQAIVNPHFLRLYLNSPTGRIAASRGSVQLAQANLSLDQIGRIAIPIPPIQEQQSLVAASAAIQHRIDREYDTLGKLRDVKLGLMEDLLTGRVRVKVG